MSHFSDSERREIRVLSVVSWAIATVLAVMAVLTAVGYLTGPDATQGFAVCAGGVVVFTGLGIWSWKLLK